MLTWIILIIVICILAYIVRFCIDGIYDNRKKREEIRKGKVKINNLVNRYQTYDMMEEKYKEYDELDRKTSKVSVEGFTKPFSAPHAGDSIYPKMIANMPRDFKIAEATEEWRKDLEQLVSSYNEAFYSLRILEQKPFTGIFYSSKGFHYLKLDWQKVTGKITQRPEIMEEVN